jgi:hypothetical protein
MQSRRVDERQAAQVEGKPAKARIEQLLQLPVYGRGGCEIKLAAGPHNYNVALGFDIHAKAWDVVRRAHGSAPISWDARG